MRSAMLSLTVAAHGPQRRFVPHLPSALAGEGTTVLQQIPMGEGLLRKMCCCEATPPHPFSFVARSEMPSPAREEGKCGHAPRSRLDCDVAFIGSHPARTCPTAWSPAARARSAER